MLHLFTCHGHIMSRLAELLLGHRTNGPYILKNLKDHVRMYKLNEHINLQACACLNIQFFKIPLVIKKKKK